MFSLVVKLFSLVVKLFSPPNSLAVFFKESSNLYILIGFLFVSVIWSGHMATEKNEEKLEYGE